MPTKDVPPLEGVSLWLLSSENGFRKLVYRITITNYFDNTMFFLIIVSCVAMAWEHPGISVQSVEWKALRYTDIVLTALFGLECALKIIAFTFRTYILSLTNQVGDMDHQCWATNLCIQIFSKYVQCGTLIHV